MLKVLIARRTPRVHEETNVPALFRLYTATAARHMSGGAEARPAYTPGPVLLAEADLQSAYAELSTISDVYTEVQQEIEVGATPCTPQRS